MIQLEVYKILKDVLLNVIHVVIFLKMGSSLNHCPAGAQFIKNGSVE